MYAYTPGVSNRNRTRAKRIILQFKGMFRDICGTHSGAAENGTWRFVVGWVFPDVSMDRIAFIFRVKQFKDDKWRGNIACVTRTQRHSVSS
jgi:hypothetical protein